MPRPNDLTNSPATPRPRITLYAYRGTWMADMGQATDADEIRRLFDTDQIPTPYTTAMNWREVQRHVETRNHGHAVLVDILSRQDTAPADLRPLADVLSPTTRATLAALAEKGGRP